MLYGKHIFLSILSAVSMLTMSSCMKEVSPDEPGDGDGGRGFYLSFDDGAGTRSELNSSEVDWRDVEDVYLYVFKGNTADAPCILFEDVDWQGNISQKHWVSADLESGQTYTFLAVGVDDRAGSVYGFPAQDWKSLTLGTLVARYAGNDKSDMVTAQLFAGYTAQNADDTEKAEVSITLRRKVAGVLAYLKNIPCSVDFSDANDGKAKVTSLRISLYQNQNTVMPMWSANPEVYGSEPMENSQVLFEVDMTLYEADSDGRYFVIPAKSGENGVQTLENSLLMGAFLLPVDNSGQDATLSLELIGEYTDSDGTEHEGVTVKSYSVTAEDGATEFPINENHLYSIGKKLSDGSTDGDKPADLSGNVLIVSVTDWCYHDIPNVFPTVTAPARVVGDFNPDNYIFDAPGTTTTVTVYPPTGDNASGKAWRMYVEYGDDENEPNNGLNADEKDWIHIVSRNAEGAVVGYVNELTFSAGSEETTVDLILNDFAVCRSKLLNDYSPGNYRYSEAEIEMARNDYRTAYVVVETEGYNTPYRMKIRQYNTLSIYAGLKPGDYWRGVARLDYGCYFDKMTGEAVCEMSQSDNEAGMGKTLNVYGYTAHGETIWHIVGDVMSDNVDELEWEGESVTLQAYAWDNPTGRSDFSTSLIGKLKKDIVYYATQPDGSVAEMDKEGHIWFLPSIQEMMNLALYYQKDATYGTDFGSVANLGWTIMYWSATPVQGFASGNLSRPNNSWSANITIPGNSGGRDETARTVQLAARPFRKFLDEDK